MLTKWNELMDVIMSALVALAKTNNEGTELVAFNIVTAGAGI